MVRAHGSIRASLFVFVHAPDLFIQPLSRKTIKTSVFILLLFGFSELRLFYFGRLADGGFFWFHCQSRCGFYPSCFWSTWVSVVYCNLIFLRGFVGFRKYFFSIYLASTFFLRCHVASGILLGPWQQSQSTRTGSCRSSGSTRLEPPADSLRVLPTAEATNLGDGSPADGSGRRATSGTERLFLCSFFHYVSRPKLPQRLNPTPQLFSSALRIFRRLTHLLQTLFFTSYFFVRPVVFFLRSLEVGGPSGGRGFTRRPLASPFMWTSGPHQPAAPRPVCSPLECEKSAEVGGGRAR